MSTEPITATVAEKPKRGRPRTVGIYTQDRGIFTEIKSRRGQENVHYMIRSFGIIGDKAEFAWLIDKTRDAYGEAKALRKTILSELGRIDDDDQLREAAAWCCEAKPTSKRAAAVLRRWRTGKSRPPNIFTLTMALSRAVDVYWNDHPDTTQKQIVAALENVIDGVKESEPQTAADAAESSRQ